jgi:thiaminase/transcriptional activator TenA
MSADPFSAEVWYAAAPVLTAIRAHPFVRGLADGTLERTRFQHYILQDALYLQGFGRALAFGAVKAPDAATILEFSRAAAVAIEVERALHAGFLTQFGVDAAAAERATPSPTCQAYCDALIIAAATGSFAELSAATLPCFWIYQDVGAAIQRSAERDNPYQAWIDTYAGADFEAATRRMIDVFDAEAAAAGPRLRERMRRRFLRSCEHEWMFWDAAWREERWPLTHDAPG